MRINAVVFLVLALLPLFATCTDDIAFWTSNGHYYQWVPMNKSLSYNDAKTMAASYIHNSKQGYIVTLGSADESAFLLSYLNTISWVAAPGGDYPTVWGGATMSSNQWTWNALGRLSSPFFDSGKLTCYSYGFCNWYVALTAANFPSSSNCLQIFLSNTSGSTSGTWRPAACTGLAQGIVIEYDASQTCDPGYVYKTSVGWCVDVNECTNSPGICGKGYNCVNTIGSYECDDINECLNTSICPSGFQCVNSPGSYSCNDINECLQSPPVCGSGYTCQNTIGSYQCNDINECQLNSSLCGKGYVCQNIPGSYQCNDINECLQAQKVCPFYTQCSNTIGSYTCDTRYFYIQSAWNQLVLDYIIDNNGIYRIITNNLNTSNPFDQLWSYNPDGFLMNRQSGYVCDAEGGLVYPGVMAILWPQKEIQNANNQLWSYNSTASIDYWYSQTANVVIDIYHGVYTPGAFVCLFTPKDPSDPSGNANQQWNIVFYSS